MFSRGYILKTSWLVALALAVAYPLKAAENLDQLVAGAKKERELVFVGPTSTFGGRKAFSELAAIFNKKYGLNARIRFTEGPPYPSMAARLITELKAGRESSTDFYNGYTAQFALLHKEKALEKVNWSGIFPWITKEMEIFPGEGVLTDTDIHGPIWNPNIIPREKAPKRYEDLVDHRLSPTWAGKLAIPPYTTWLTDLSLIWGEEKVKDFTRKLVPVSGGRIGYGEEERIVSGEFPIMADMGSALSRMWEWQSKGAPLVAVPGSTPVLSLYILLGVPKNSAHPNLARLFVGFMVSKEGQAIMEKHAFRSSHLVEGTIAAKYVRDNRLELLDPSKVKEFYLKEDASGLQLRKELDQLLKQ